MLANVPWDALADTDALAQSSVLMSLGWYNCLLEEDGWRGK